VTAALRIGRCRGAALTSTDSLAQPPASDPTIATSRKILCAAALAALGLLALPTAAPAARLRLQHAGLSQAGRELIFTVRTAKPVPLSQLQPRPDTRRGSASYLCLSLSRSGHAGARHLCLGGHGAHRRLGVVTVNGSEKPLQEESVAARLKRPSPGKLVVALDPKAAGLTPDHYEWRVLASVGCEVGRRCAESLPARGSYAFRLRPVRAVGCTGGSAGLVTNGPHNRPTVALTFDDGPSEYTDDFLAVLREKGVRATFFEVGQEMPGREGTMRRILAEGDEIGDHTMNHVEYPGYVQIAGAAARIEDYTHFKPCLFRPPGGGVDASVIATAGGLGMRTVNWDVDPRDWSLPGTGAIYSNIVANARNGSIILMHDGGGPRSETLAALPQVIDSLRARGFAFSTVSELLGYRLIYRPYG
jgi:peptidoglycan-N-acetylglucosamine deacetylase